MFGRMVQYRLLEVYIVDIEALKPSIDQEQLLVFRICDFCSDKFGLCYMQSDEQIKVLKAAITANFHHLRKDDWQEFLDRHIDQFKIATFI